MRAKDRGRADFAGKDFGLKDAALNARRAQLLPRTGKASGNCAGIFPTTSARFLPRSPPRRTRNVRQADTEHRLRRRRAFQRLSPPLSRALCFSPVLLPGLSSSRQKGPLPAADFCRRILSHTGGFSRANVERRKRAEGSLLPPFRVCHCQTADAARSTRVLWIISPERPLPPPLQRLR